MIFFLLVHAAFGAALMATAMLFPYAVPALGLWYGEYQQSKHTIPGSIKDPVKIKAMLKDATLNKFKQWAVGIPVGAAAYFI
jgi:hypothetical protein